jgi:phosphoribosylamine--glycine ligase
MKVLVIGGGGREHALCWKLRQSPLLTELYCAPGNPGIGELADLAPIASEEVARLADFAADAKVELTVVGPELSLSLGIANEFHGRGLRIFGPTRRAAEIESSKAFAKEFMARHRIPTAPFEIASDAAEARRAAERFGIPFMLKADGLAGGKGVFLIESEAEREEVLQDLFEERRFGVAGERVVLERFLTGEEVSCMALCDGERVLPLAVAKDYKRLEDGDTGPNTGGMGAHSPAGLLRAADAADILERILLPTAAGLAEENRAFVGVLYAGLMLTDDGPQVLEFNARFGDPEAQAVLPRLESDLLELLAAGAAGDFGGVRPQFRKEAAACVVLASSGYPANPVKGEPITGVERAAALDNVQVFHAGTALRDGQLVSAGGRVLNVCATGPTLSEALRTAYAAAGEIEWPSKILRRDIGRRVLESALSEDAE